MKSFKGRGGFVAGALSAAAGVMIFASSAFAGFVVDVGVEVVPATATEKVPPTIVVKMQDKKSRIDMDKVSIISTVGEPTTTILIHDKKMVMVAPTPKPAAKTDEKDMDKPKATGKKDKISGYDVEEYLLEKPNQKVTIWMTQDAGALKLREGMEEMFAKQAQGKNQVNFKEMPGCPIKVIVDVPAHTETRPNGKTVDRPASKATMTIKSIKEEALGDAVFATPADYQDMMKMMQNAGGAGGVQPRGVAPAKP